MVPPRGVTIEGFDCVYVIRCYVITKDALTKEDMLIMNYVNGGNVHDYLQIIYKYTKNFTWIFIIFYLITYFKFIDCSITF